MRLLKALAVLLVVLSASAAAKAADHPILQPGSSAPYFALPGVDGRVHKLTDYAASKVLVVVFMCNHCPIAQMYEQRVQQLMNDYKAKGVAVVAIEGNDPKAVRIDELDSSDISDTLPEMKQRVAYKHLTYPYLYDGDTQKVTRAYGPQATPHVFIFDKQRKLQYEGRIDNSYRIEQVKTNDARSAIDALLAGKEVAVKHTGSFGCSTKWSEKAADKVAAIQKLEAEPVTVTPIGKAELATLRASKGKYTLVDFWATWCGSCIAEFGDIQDLLRMYGPRDLNVVTVSANQPDEKNSVLRFLQKKHATSTNYIFNSEDTASLQKAFDPKWDSAVPYTVLLGPDGRVIWKTMGSANMLELRRTILANLPSDYIGFNKYWQTASVSVPKKK
jgi:thiol-disulfide isomerase/thioredoxin